MPIKIFPDRIQIGNFNLFEGNGGVQFDGEARAENFQASNSPHYGTVAGFVYGGYGGGGFENTVNRFSFSNEVPVATTSALSFAKGVNAGLSSETDGYAYRGGSPNPANAPLLPRIERHPFASTYPMATAGTATNAVGHTSWSTSEIGIVAAYPNLGFEILKFSSTSTAATPTTATGTPSFPTSSSVGGQSSGTHAYGTGVYIGNPIYKFPFATILPAVDVGDLTEGRSNPAGMSSPTYGYSAGGYKVPAVNTIDKFPFANETNASDVGDLAAVQQATAGWSSLTNGYTMAPLGSSVFNKFPFATDTNAANLTGGVGRQSIRGGTD